MGFYWTFSISCLFWHAQTTGSIPPAYAWSNARLSRIPLWRDIHCCIVHELPPHRGQQVYQDRSICICSLLNHGRTTCFRVTFNIKGTFLNSWLENVRRVFWPYLPVMIMCQVSSLKGCSQWFEVTKWPEVGSLNDKYLYINMFFYFNFLTLKFSENQVYVLIDMLLVSLI